MSRWIWIALIGLSAALWWKGQRHAAPMAASALSDGASIECVPPRPFTDPDQPLQSPLDDRMPAFRLGAAKVTPLAGFSLQARVLSREDYSLGAEAEYSPTDLALGWGPMTDPDITGKLDISQGGRWYHYRWGEAGPPIPLRQIIGYSANMHMVPADGLVARSLEKVRDGDTVRIDGWLIRIDRDDGWRWQSSLTREDSGGGACELVYVCSIEKQ